MSFADRLRSLFTPNIEQPLSNNEWLNDTLNREFLRCETRRFEALASAKRLLETAETPDWASSWSGVATGSAEHKQAREARPCTPR